MSPKVKDIIVRAAKTFAQTFGGVFVPGITLVLSGGFPESWSKWWVLLAPLVSSSLAAAISAAWNTISLYLDDAKEVNDHE